MHIAARQYVPQMAYYIYSICLNLTHFSPQLHKLEHSQYLVKIAEKFGQKWVKHKIEIILGSRISIFLRPAQRYDDFKLIRHTSLTHRAKLLLSSLPAVSPSRVLRAPGTPSYPRVLRAPGTSSYHLVPKYLRAT